MALVPVSEHVSEDPVRMALGNTVFEVLEGSLESVLEALPRVGRRQAAEQRIETVGYCCLELAYVRRAVDPDQVVVEAKKEFGRVRCDDAGPESVSCLAGDCYDRAPRTGGGRGDVKKRQAAGFLERAPCSVAEIETGIMHPQGPPDGRRRNRRSAQGDHFMAAGLRPPSHRAAPVPERHGIRTVRRRDEDQRAHISTFCFGEQIVDYLLDTYAISRRIEDPEESLPNLVSFLHMRRDLPGGQLQAIAERQHGKVGGRMLFRPRGDRSDETDLITSCHVESLRVDLVGVIRSPRHRRPRLAWCHRVEEESGSAKAGAWRWHFSTPSRPPR